MAIHPLWLGATMLVGLVVIGAFVMLIVLVARSLSPHGPFVSPNPASSRETPVDILARRFASGEITAEEYERARKLLKEGPGS